MNRLRMIVIAALVCALPTTLAGAASTPGAGSQARAAKAALAEVGVPYVWGGASPSAGFDSSGLIVWAYAQAGRGGLPQFTGALWTSGKHVSRAHLRPGDLVFFYDAGHVGIYLGHGRFVHATHTGSTVKIARLRGAYAKGFTGAVRIS
jgi:cell wall-associated NlpC family hydrolase